MDGKVTQVVTTSLLLVGSGAVLLSCYAHSVQIKRWWRSPRWLLYSIISKTLRASARFHFIPKKWISKIFLRLQNPLKQQVMYLIQKLPPSCLYEDELQTEYEKWQTTKGAGESFDELEYFERFCKELMITMDDAPRNMCLSKYTQLLNSSYPLKYEGRNVRKLYYLLGYNCPLCSPLSTSDLNTNHNHNNNINNNNNNNNNNVNNINIILRDENNKSNEEEILEENINKEVMIDDEKENIMIKEIKGDDNTSKDNKKYRRGKQNKQPAKTSRVKKGNEMNYQTIINFSKHHHNTRLIDMSPEEILLSLNENYQIEHCTHTPPFVSLFNIFKFYDQIPQGRLYQQYLHYNNELNKTQLSDNNLLQSKIREGIVKKYPTLSEADLTSRLNQILQSSVEKYDRFSASLSQTHLKMHADPQYRLYLQIKKLWELCHCNIFYDEYKKMELMIGSERRMRGNAFESETLEIVFEMIRSHLLRKYPHRFANLHLHYSANATWIDPHCSSIGEIDLLIYIECEEEEEAPNHMNDDNDDNDDDDDADDRVFGENGDDLPVENDLEENYPSPSLSDPSLNPSPSPSPSLSDPSLTSPSDPSLYPSLNPTAEGVKEDKVEMKKKTAKKVEKNRKRISIMRNKTKSHFQTLKRKQKKKYEAVALIEMKANFFEIPSGFAQHSSKITSSNSIISPDRNIVIDINENQLPEIYLITLIPDHDYLIRSDKPVIETVTIEYTLNPTLFDDRFLLNELREKIRSSDSFIPLSALHFLRFNQNIFILY